MNRTSLWCGSIALIMVFVLPVLGTDLQPLTVSPGATDRLTGVEVRCPTFSWQAIDGVVGYEVVVYELPPEIDLSGWSLDDAVEALYVELPAGVTAWTPSLENGLWRGADHVWFVRGVFGAGSAEEWSEPRFFRVAGGISEPGNMAQGSRGRASSRSETGAGTGVGASSSRVRGVGDGRRAVESRVAETKTKDVGSALAAIRGEVPDPTGEIYGVVGTSNSPNGAGLGAVNTAGGADLVLDGNAQGVADADLSESGIDRASSTAQSFDFTNSDTGIMTLRVDGVDVVTTLTDQDTLTGLSCVSGEIAKWNGSLWACAPDANTGTDTLAGLSCVSGEIAKWNGSLWVCAPDGDTLAALSCARNEIAKWNGTDWACSPDENTTYMFGTGLTLNNGQIVIDPSVFTTRITTLDSAGEVGRSSSLAIGVDLLGLISYFDSTNGDLKVAHCSDPACTSAALSTLDSAGTVGGHTSVAIGADGLGLIGYYAGDPFFNLKVAHCSDFYCTSANISTLDTAGDVGEYTSVAIGADGFGLISYYDRTNGNLKVAHCSDTACTSATINAIDSTGDVGRYTSVAIGADGLGLIGYHDDVTGGHLKVAHCDNAACTSATINTVDSSGSVGVNTSVAIGADGLGLISHHDYFNDDLRVAHCDDVACTSATLSNLDSAGVVGNFTSLAIGVDGLGLISYYDNSNDDLKVAHCRDVACTSAIISIVDSAGDFGPGTSLAIGADWRGLVSYSEVTNNDLRVAHLPIGY